MPVMREVFSSSVDRIGHDATTGDLVVQWSGGRRSVYSGVPAAVADDVMNAWSVGQALNAAIKPHFEHRYMEEE